MEKGFQKLETFLDIAADVDIVKNQVHGIVTMILNLDKEEKMLKNSWKII